MDFENKIHEFHQQLNNKGCILKLNTYPTYRYNSVGPTILFQTHPYCKLYTIKFFRDKSNNLQWSATFLQGKFIFLILTTQVMISA